MFSYLSSCSDDIITKDCRLAETRKYLNRDDDQSPLIGQLPVQSDYRPAQRVFQLAKKRLVSPYYKRLFKDVTKRKKENKILAGS